MPTNSGEFHLMDAEGAKGYPPNLSGKRTEVLTDYSDFQSAVCCRLFFFTNRLCFIANKKESICLTVLFQLLKK